MGGTGEKLVWGSLTEWNIGLIMRKMLTIGLTRTSLEHCGVASRGRLNVKRYY